MEKRKRKKVKKKDTLSFNVPLSSDSNTYGTVTFQTKDLEKASHFPIENSEETFKIPKELEDEIEKQLEEKAQKTNLTVANVKNMIRTVIMSEDVVKLVKATLTDSPVEPLRFEPKLTRAKKKELEKEWNWAVPLPPANKAKRSGDDIVALIDQDLPEDSSDEEYQPVEEESDDEESRASDILGFDEELLGEWFSCSSPAVPSESGPDAIGQRTRSKLSLNQTPLETIEQAFIPPDITTDMYNTECDNQDWANFLKAFSKPLDSSVLNESVDDDNDPEYSVTIEDVEEKPDDEELRDDRAVKVSKKEVNALLTELYEYTNMVSPDPSAPDCLLDSLVEGDEPSPPSSPEPEPQSQIPAFELEQIELIEQQMRQHVQLLTQSFLLSYGHPYIDSFFSETFKSLLLDIAKLQSVNKESLFNVANLPCALTLIRKWEREVDSDPSIKEHLKKEWEKSDGRRKTKNIYLPRMPEKMMLLCLESRAFVYPLLLPENGFRPVQYLKQFCKAESELFALGLEEFVTLVKGNPDEFKDYSLEDILELVKAYLIPTKSVKYLMKQIDKAETSETMTPIKYYLTHGKTPSFIHYVTPIEQPLKKLINQPYAVLSEQWVKFVEKTKMSRAKK